MEVHALTGRKGLKEEITDCTCPPQFSGAFCEEMMRYCDLLPCFNGGLCQDTMSEYICDCPAGFIGHNCEINMDECSSQPCLNGGSCFDGINNFSCICNVRYAGDLCENVVGPCASCLSNGSCVYTETNWCVQIDCYDSYITTVTLWNYFFEHKSSWDITSS
ncbi:fibropellin-3-like [Amblyraja radiata]|uniref:fibropellin-3-like n=1 Tax=Amblyraja radiata TaxID=386614 RepID=UPI00140409E4|nr:fibropellin-3-like [Amblyraja radiata]